MGQRSAALLTLLVLLIALLAALSGPTVRADNVAEPDPGPPTTVNDFFPETENVSDCIGVLERPGCGSEARGGWRQSLLFVVTVGGLAVIFGRIAYSVRRNRRPAP